jgi:hypothetical protein
LGSLGCANAPTLVSNASGELRLNRYSLQDDIDIGSEQSTLFIAASESLAHTLDPDHEHTRVVRRVAARILDVAENRARMPPLPWEVHTIGSEHRNAFALAGGTVFVLCGLLRWGFVRTEDELAAIIGHEMAHAALRHATERATVAELRSRARLLGTFFGQRSVELLAPDAPESVLAFVSKDSRQFDRAQEIEADIIGLELMARAGFDPAAAVSVWRRAAETHQLAEAGATETHPSYERRVAELESHLAAARYVASRSSPVSAREPGWRFEVTESDQPVPSERLPESGALTEGAHVPSRYVKASPSVARVRVRAFTTTEGAAPRAEVGLIVSRDLAEDGLPVSVVLYVERPEGAVLHGERLSTQSPLTGARTIFRRALPSLRPGRYRIRARALIGSLSAEDEVVLSISEPARMTP